MDIKEPVELAEDVYWVGANIPDDQFQCHVYLIKNGEESIIIDPGSRITYDITKRKIEQLIDLKDIKYIVCHHQDPDIVGCVDQLLSDMGNDRERFLITHWRAWALLKHCNWDVKLYEIEKNGWRLKTGDRLSGLFSHHISTFLERFVPTTVKQRPYFQAISSVDLHLSLSYLQRVLMITLKN